MNVQMKDEISVFSELSPAQIPEQFEDFLAMLAGPAEIWVKGEDITRTRVVVTLLHGNEPSGAKAIFRFLKEGIVPHTNLLVLLGSVQSALMEPAFRNRSYPGARDMNRCFNPPYSDPPGRIAKQILTRINDSQAEAVVDLHNTSGTSPSFAVVTRENAAHETLVSLFTDKLVVTELRLGSLMEQSSDSCPVVTIECGGAADEDSDRVAYKGLLAFATEEALIHPGQDLDLDLYHHPIRLELEQGTRLAFSDQPALGMEITLLPDVDQYNFNSVPQGALLGWVKNAEVCSRLRVVGPQGEKPFADYFELCGNRLQTVKSLKLFMITTRPDIALSDCLLYAAYESEHEKIHVHIAADQETA